jgi:TPP-dependent pyruvate/acetoin dehydrogenase alpha subunit
MTYRWMEHVGPNQDYHIGYRSKDEAALWMEQDQVKIMGEKLNPQLRQQIEAEVEAEIAAAFEFAEQSSFPAISEVHTDLFEEKL